MNPQYPQYPPNSQYPPQYPPQYAQPNQFTPPTTPRRRRPDWARRLETLYLARVARQFVLHFNINDYSVDLTSAQARDAEGHVIEVITPETVWLGDEPPTFRQYLHDMLFESSAFSCQAIYTYSLAAGLLADDREHRGLGQPLAQELNGPTLARFSDAVTKLGLSRRGGRGGQQVEGQEVNLPGMVDNLKALGHILRQKHGEDGTAYSATEEIRDERPIAVILDYAEKLVPYHVGEGQGQQEQLQALETIQSWALDPLIRATNNVVILLTTNVGHLPPVVFSEGSGSREIRVSLPSEEEREAFIARKAQANSLRYKLATIANEFGDTSISPVGMPGINLPQLKELCHGLAISTQGMRLKDIDALNREIVIRWVQERAQGRSWNELLDLAFRPGGAAITTEDVRKAKAETIERQSAQLLEIVPPERGFDQIGGLEKLKDYLRVRTKMMRKRKHSPLIPSGLLLAGPPGTGKTIIAEALATEGQFNLVKMRNIQDRWVGSSERNLDMVLSLLQDLHPVIVFVDEIDQAMGRRDTGQNGDSGVSARMFARILEEMSKASNRGRVMWVAATNRTDFLDDALLRRFDRVVPLIAPDAEESRRIFAAMAGMITKQTGKVINVTYGGDLAQSGNKDAEGRSSPTKEDLNRFNGVAHVSADTGLTGAEIEIVVRRAVEIASEDALKSNGELSDTDLPMVTSQHLYAAMHDFKINHNPVMYDYQSLLAIRSCNFYSVLPQADEFPDRPVFKQIVGPDGRVDPARLDVQIQRLQNELNRDQN